MNFILVPIGTRKSLLQVSAYMALEYGIIMRF